MWRRNESLRCLILFAVDIFLCCFYKLSTLKLLKWRNDMEMIFFFMQTLDSVDCWKVSFLFFEFQIEIKFIRVKLLFSTVENEEDIVIGPLARISGSASSSSQFSRPELSSMLCKQLLLSSLFSHYCVSLSSFASLSLFLLLRLFQSSLVKKTLSV